MSCSIEDEKNQLNNTSEVYYTDGSIHFRDMQSFEKTIKQISTFDSMQYVAWKQNFEGFISMKDKYATLLEINDNESETEFKSLEELVREANLPYIPSLSFAAVVNENGVYEVGDEIKRISSDNYEYIYRYDKTILNLRESISDYSDNNVVKFKIENVLDETKSNHRTNWMYGESYEWMTPYLAEFNDDRHHLDIRAWALNYSSHSSMGVSMTGRRYKKTCWFCQWKWRNDDMEYARISGDFAYVPISVMTQVPFYRMVTFGGHTEYIQVEDIIYGSETPILGASMRVDYIYEDGGYPERSYYREYY